MFHGGYLFASQVDLSHCFAKFLGLFVYLFAEGFHPSVKRRIPRASNSSQSRSSTASANRRQAPRTSSHSHSITPIPILPPFPLDSQLFDLPLYFSNFPSKYVLLFLQLLNFFEVYDLRGLQSDGF